MNELAQMKVSLLINRSCLDVAKLWQRLSLLPKTSLDECGSVTHFDIALTKAVGFTSQCLLIVLPLVNTYYQFN